MAVNNEATSADPPKARVALLSDTSGSLHPGSRVASDNIARLLAAEGLEIAVRTPFMRPPTGRTREKMAKEDVRAIVLHSEGGLHHSATRPKVSALLKAAVDLKHQTGLPLVLINAVIDDLDGEALSHLAAFDARFVRDSKSKAELAAAGLSATWLPDLSLAFERPFEAAERNGVLITDSVRDDVRAALARNPAIAVMTMDPRDMAGRLYRFRRFAPIDASLRAKHPPEKFLTRIASAEAALTGRFHGMMFCLLAQTPFLAIASNTHKMRSALLDIFGNTKRLIDAEAVTGGDFAALAKSVPPFDAAERDAVSAYIARCRGGGPAMARTIAKFAEGALQTP